MVSKPAVVTFATVDVPAPRRVQLWEEDNASSLISLHCKTLSGLALDATKQSVAVHNVRMAHVSGSPHIVERTASDIKAHPTDSLVAYFAVRGDAFFYHEDGCEMLRPGQAVVYDCDRPFVRGFSHGLDEFVLSVPRSDLRDASRTKMVDGVRIVDFGKDLHAKALLHLVKSTLRGNDESGDVVAHARPGAAYLAAARLHITENVHDLNLSVSRTAGVIGLSERHLSRLFNADGQSVSHFILDARLANAHTLLMTSPAMTMTEISRRSGFASASYFARSYKTRYGHTPSETRALHTTGR